MSENNRDHIPNSLLRDLMLEAGYRCSICKSTDALEIDHIDEYSEVKNHTFDNMIVLCPNCHSRKQDTNNPRHINKISLKKIKSDLMLINSRYSDLEKRIIAQFKNDVNKNIQSSSIIIPEMLYILVSNLKLDEIISFKRYDGGMRTDFPDGTVIGDFYLKLELTDKGIVFIKNLSI